MRLSPRRIGALLPRPASNGNRSSVALDVESAVHAFLYDAEATDGRVSLDEIAVERLSETQLLWIDVTEARLESTAAALGLAAETVRAIREPVREPVLFAHDGYVHLVVIAPGQGALQRDPRPLHCVVGPNWILTVHREPIAFLDHFDERIRGDTDLGKLDAYAFLAAVLHEHVGSYLSEIRPIEDELDRLDVRSMTGHVEEKALLQALVSTRIRLAKLRRLLEPHRELYSLLGRSDFTVLSGSRSGADFEALGEHLERALQSMETTREMIMGSFDIYTTWTAHGTNSVMKRLTVASLTLLPPTLLAGVMGMNSLPAAFQGAATFWVTTTAMVGLAVTVLVVARLRDWI